MKMVIPTQSKSWQSHILSAIGLMQSFRTPDRDVESDIQPSSPRIRDVANDVMVCPPDTTVAFRLYLVVSNTESLAVPLSHPLP
ncbi:hypothetical protein AVEN_109177-1 [Araneus ventricosus]|uniref:Uncharacterized protein n=1 Tax=Araneus ventricosus TaxID=182803 RepID=A0A4Y2L456_ARAVE|nr:hypothetical protein AVEN_109177-1 [Araneus ventricosus]